MQKAQRVQRPCGEYRLRPVEEQREVHVAGGHEQGQSERR